MKNLHFQEIRIRMVKIDLPHLFSDAYIWSLNSTCSRSSF
jgi:hypothetical protein